MKLLGDLLTIISRPVEGPAPFAGILYEARVLGERGFLRQCYGRQIQQPRAYDTAAPPHLGDVSQVQIIAMLFRHLLGASIAEDVKALGIGLHEAVFNSVMHHFHKMSRARGTA